LTWTEVLMSVSNTMYYLGTVELGVLLRAILTCLSKSTSFCVGCIVEVGVDYLLIAKPVCIYPIENPALL
jgi:hypothetical protein